MVTQKKIAELVGVSRGTVDRVLNNRGDVSPETREKILEIAKMMDYTPNRAGKTLVIRQKNLKIGCIIIHADNPFYRDLNQGIQEKAEEYKSYGIKVIIKYAVFEAESQIEKIDELLAEGINGLVIQPANESILSEKLKQVADSGIPVVTMNTDLGGFDRFCYIGNDFYTCGKTAANLMDLTTSGPCNIGIITGFSKAKSHSDRIEGFRDYIKDLSRFRIIDIRENHDDELESYKVTTAMLNEHPEINAVFIVAGGVNGAGRALKEFQASRLIRAISFDDVPTTKELVRNGVISATICQQPVRQGRLSLEVLLNYFLDNQPPKVREIYTDIQIKLKANIDA
jgi:LacI family transcriptional regulator